MEELTMRNVDALFQQGFAMHQQGYLAEAKNFYEQVISINPEHFDALHLLGLIWAHNKKPAQALYFLKKATLIDTNYAPAFYNLGVVLQDLNSFKEALASLDRAIALKPDYAEAYANRGNSLHELQKYDQSVASYDRAIALKPDYAKAWYNRGNSLLKLQKYDQSVSSYDRAIALKPDYAEAYSNRGLALHELKQYQQSVASYDRAIALKPDYADAWYNRGNLLHELQKYDQSVASYDQAIALKPDYAEAYANRGNVLCSVCRYEEADDSYREALRINPNDLDARSGWLFSMNYHASLNLQHALSEAKIYGSKTSENSIPKFKKWDVASKANKLKIGFVSGDLCNHPVGYFIEGLIEYLDPNQFELYAFTTNSLTDELTIRIKPFFNEYTLIYGMSDLDAATLIHKKGIHVLLDLSGHSKYQRLPVFSYKPAPVQVSWLGYFATTGLPEMDYFLGDPYMLHISEENHFTESAWKLAETWLCLKPPNFGFSVSKLPAIKNGFLTFGSFGNLSKMNNQVVTTWASVLHGIPTSKLFLKAKQLKDVSQIEDVQKRFAKCGISTDRLILESAESREAYFLAHNEVDFILDTFPYPGGTTSVDAFWMGVPVLTLRGDRFLSHLGESIAINSGNADWIAQNLHDYVSKAVQFSTNLERLAQLRSTSRERAIKSPLYDSVRFAKNFGDALWGMYYQSSIKPPLK